MPSPEKDAGARQGATPGLRPREHGAYAMLTFPAVSGLVMGGLTWAGLAFIAMAVTGFLAHESVLVVLGGRGERIRTKREAAARGRLVRLGLTMATLAVLFALTVPPGAWRPGALAAGLGVAVGMLLLLGRTKSLIGEVLVAGAFSSVHAVAAAAGGVGGGRVWLPALAWTASFTLATLSVHALKYRFRRKGPGGWAVVASPVFAVLALGTGALGAAGLMGTPALGWAAAALTPKALGVLSLSLVEVHPKHLKRVGWSFVGADVATLVLLVSLLRATG